MLRKILAALLLVLAASPFTAPFSTCDVATLMGGDSLAARYQSSIPPVVDQSQAAALCAAPHRTRARIKAAAEGLTLAAAPQSASPLRPPVFPTLRPARRACADPPSLTTLRI